MNTGRPGIPGRSAKSATDENGGSAESLTAALEGKPGPARPAGPALAALGGGSGCGGLGPPQLRQPLPVCPAQGRSRLPPRLQARPQGPGPGGRGTYEGTPGVYPGPPPGPTGARWGCGARWPLCPPTPRVWCRYPWWFPCAKSGAPWLSRPAPGGRRATKGPRVPRTPARGVVVGGWVGRADVPVPRPTAGDVGKVEELYPRRQGSRQAAPDGAGGRPCLRGWVRWPAAVVVRPLGGGPGPASVAWWFRPGVARVARLGLVPPGDTRPPATCQGS